jgi:hypothetical protein
VIAVKIPAKPVISGLSVGVVDAAIAPTNWGYRAEEQIPNGPTFLSRRSIPVP